MKKALVITILLSFLTSCYESMPKSWNWGMKPRPLTGVRGFPEADTDYGKGFRDGCTNGLISSGKGWTDTLQNQLNPVMMVGNPDYSSGWTDGFDQCVYILDWDVK
jgi:hypothetical protein